MFSPLQYISQGNTAADQFSHICSALDAGCQWIQLRFKNAPTAHITGLAEQVRTRCTAYGAILIINDHPLVARIAEADGVHLGLTDMTVSEAKEIVGIGKIIGGTANTLEDILQRAEEGCSYIGLGPLRYTTAKKKFKPVLGIQGYQDIITCLVRRGISIPVYAVGGIVLDDLPALLQTGVSGVALSGLITHHPNKQQLIAQFNSTMSMYATVR
jgi:thiamine-phosphate pyrophosphorylase